jgi:NADH dehydrogenase
MILVAGATGVVGRMIVMRLLERGEAVRILVRPDSSADELMVAGAEPAIGDLKEPATLAGACAGVDAVITTANASQPRLPGDTPETVDDAGNKALFEAAREAGVRHVVYVSAGIADAASPVPFLRAKGRAELHLEGSGVPYTILRPDAFMESWPTLVVGMPAMAGRPVRLPRTPVARHSFISAADVAAYAAAMVGRVEAMGHRFELGGPEPMSWADVAETYSRILGREVAIEVVGPDGDLSPLSPVQVALISTFESFESIVDPGPVARAFGVEPTSLETVIRRMLPVPA